MSLRATRHKRRLVADINVTPLVDVMLVLLIVFMISAPLMRSGLRVELPQAGGQTLRERRKAVELVIQRDGALSIDGEKLTLDALIPFMSEKLGARSHNTVRVSGDKAVPYGEMMQVMAVLKRAGYHKLALVSEGSKPPKRT